MDEFDLGTPQINPKIEGTIDATSFLTGYLREHPDDRFAEKFKTEVIEPLINKLASSLKVQDTKIDLKSLTADISNLLGGKEFSFLTNMKYQKIVRDLLEKIKKAVPSQLSFKDVGVSDLFKAPAKVGFLDPFLEIPRKYNTLVKKVLDQLKESTGTMKFSSEGLTFPELFGATPKKSILTYFKYQKLVKDAMGSLDKTVKNLKFSNEEVTFDQLFGVSPKASLLNRMRYQGMLKRVMKQIEATQLEKAKKGEDTTANRPAGSEAGAGTFKSTFEPSKDVIVAGFSTKALESLKKYLGGDKTAALAITPEKDSWIKSIKDRLKKYLLPALLAIAAIATMVMGMAEGGPFKGAMKVLSRFSVVAMGKKLGPMILSHLDDFAKMFVSSIGKVFGFFKGMIMKLFGAGGKALTGAVAKAGGEGLIKGMVGKVGTWLLKRIKFIPLVGTLIGIGFAVSRFKQGDIVGGVIDLVSALVALVPGVGTTLSIAIDVFSAWRDVKTGGPAGLKAGRKDPVKEIGIKMWNWMKVRSPIKNWIYMYEAFKAFFRGNWAEGFNKFYLGVTDFPIMRDVIGFMKGFFATVKDKQATAPVGKSISFGEAMTDALTDKAARWFKANPWAWPLAKYGLPDSVIKAIESKSGGIPKMDEAAEAYTVQKAQRRAVLDKRTADLAVGKTPEAWVGETQVAETETPVAEETGVGDIDSMMKKVGMGKGISSLLSALTPGNMKTMLEPGLPKAGEAPSPVAEAKAATEPEPNFLTKLMGGMEKQFGQLSTTIGSLAQASSGSKNKSEGLDSIPSDVASRHPPAYENRSRVWEKIRGDYEVA